MSNIAILNDLHWGKFSDANFMLDIQENFFSKTFIPYIIKENISTVYILGDLFDKRKVINVNTLYRAKEMFFDVLRDYNITIHILPGNHDCSFKNTNKINSLTTTLKEYDNVKIHETPTTVDIDNSVAFIPWINSENQTDVLKFVETTKAKYLCGHLELSGFDMYRGIPQKHGMDSGIFKKFDKVLTGHYHLRSTKNNIYYLGSQFQFTWADYGEKKFFHVFNPVENTLELVENPYNLYERIYYDDSLEDYKNFDVATLENKIVEISIVKKTDAKKFDAFIERVQTISLIDLKIKESPNQRITLDDVDTDTISEKTTKELIEMYIDDIDVDLDKTKLKSILGGLYVDAMHEGLN